MFLEKKIGPNFSRFQFLTKIITRFLQQVRGGSQNIKRIKFSKKGFISGLQPNLAKSSVDDLPVWLHEKGNLVSHFCKSTFHFLY
jgi:hypothetical protein